jgi:hypothetical protein
LGDFKVSNVSFVLSRQKSCMKRLKSGVKGKGDGSHSAIQPMTTSPCQVFAGEGLLSVCGRQPGGANAKKQLTGPGKPS